MPDSTRQLLDRCISLLLSKKAEDILVQDLRDAADFTDYFLICTGNSDVHVKAIADSLLEGMKKAGHGPWHLEGAESRKWVLVDFVDVVVHIFQPEARAFYGLERLWGDTPSERIETDAFVETVEV